jgi:hypothetical protein
MLVNISMTKYVYLTGCRYVCITLSGNEERGQPTGARILSLPFNYFQGLEYLEL